MNNNSAAGITIIDIANACGVSKSTVSRVFNDSPSVAPEAREMVMRVASELGYNPENSSRRGRPKKNAISEKHETNGKSIGMIVPDPNPASARTRLSANLAQGMMSYASSHRMEFLMGHIEEHGGLPEWITQKKVDGFAVRTGKDLISIREQSGNLPMVVMMESEAPTRMRNVDAVQPDNRQVGLLAMEELTRLGCHRMTVLTSEQHWLPEHERSHEFKRQASIQGLEVRSLNLNDVMTSPELLQTGTSDGAEGLFLPVGDIISIRLCRMLEEVDFRLHENLHLISCVNEPESLWAYDGKIPTIGMRSDVIGHVAAELIERRRKNPKAEPVCQLVRPVLLNSPTTASTNFEKY